MIQYNAITGSLHIKVMKIVWCEMPVELLKINTERLVFARFENQFYMH